MSGFGRLTIWTTGGLLLVLAGGVLLLISALDRKLEPVCLDAVAPPPDGAFVRVVEERGERLHLTYDDSITLEVPKGPRRIVSGLPGITEMICHLGGRERLAAVTEHCDHPASVTSLPKVSVLPFDPEGVLAARADLVVLDRRLHRSAVARVRARVGAVLLLDSSRSLPHLVASMRTLALVLGTEEALERQAAFSRRAHALATELAASAPQPPPRVLVAAQWDPLYVLGRGSLIDDLLRVCGCVNAACDLKTDASGTFSEELVLARQPAWILTPGRPLPDRLRERWRTVPAVRNNHFVDGSRDDLVRAGPRVLDALEQLAKRLQEAP